MTNISKLVSYQWASYWRRLRRAGSVGAANQGIVLLVLSLVALKYFQLLRTATIDLTNGRTTLLTSLLTGIFIAWFLPFAGGTQGTVHWRRFLHLPLPQRQLFSVRVLSSLIPPTSWLLVIVSLAISYPLSYTPNPAAGITSALLFVVTSWLLGIAVANLTSIPIWRKVFIFVILAALLAGALSFREGIGLGSLNILATISPATLVTEAAFGNRTFAVMGALAVSTLAALLLAFWSFRQSLEVVSRRGRKRVLGSIRLAGRLGGLITKDFRYFRRLLDPYMGVLVSVMCCFHLVVAQSPSADVVRIFILVMFLGNSAVAFNLFGLDDRNGLNRYTLLPLTGAATLVSKNVAFTILVGAQLLPVLVLTLWRLGAWETLGGILQAIALTMAYLAWGNWMSVSHPMKMQFFRFSSSGSALADIIGGLIFGSLPGVVAIYLLRDERMWLVLLMLLLYGAIYFASLNVFGSRLGRRREEIANALS